MKKSFMKRLLALALVIISVLSVSAVAFAESTLYGKCATNEYINVRDAASSSGARIYRLRNGEPVTATGTTQNGYTKISSPVNGWVMTSWLTSSAPAWKTRYGTKTMNLATHDQLKAFQQDLNKISGITAIAEDGVWGNNTKEAVKQLQEKAGITVDGIAGTYTKIWCYNLSH